MSFADNLRAVRKERAVSQEDLAELLDVSRQAVSKWEQGIGYPEMEKMMILAKELNVSLDYLVSGESEAVEPQKQGASPTGRIIIKSQDGKSTISCMKVSSFSVSTRIFKSKADEPQYALFGIDAVTFWGDNRTLLGWYTDEESIEKEQGEIMAALNNGKPSYELKYAAKVKTGFLSVKLDE